jgi:hypothetical protein
LVRGGFRRAELQGHTAAFDEWAIDALAGMTWHGIVVEPDAFAANGTFVMDTCASRPNAFPNLVVSM